MKKNELYLSEDNIIDLKALLFKYLNNWTWILAGLLLGLIFAFLTLTYSTKLYTSQAKVRLLDQKETSQLTIDFDNMMNRSNINLDNEIALFKSLRINKEVVKRLNANIVYQYEDNLKSTQIYKLPFEFIYEPEKDTLNEFNVYEIVVSAQGFEISNKEGYSKKIEGNRFTNSNAYLPFTLKMEYDKMSMIEEPLHYTVSVSDIESTAKRLINAIEIEPYTEFSDILTLNLTSFSRSYGQDVLNTLIEVYIEDGIKDRKRMTERTIEFIDERLAFFTTELDSIEQSKKSFKQNNDLSIFEADASVMTESKLAKEDQLFDVETQMILAEALEKSLTQNDNFQLLPTDIGLSSNSVNSLVKDYNKTLLEYNKLKTSAGDRNPIVQILRENIIELNQNIETSLKAYKNQLNKIKTQNQKAQARVDRTFRSLPNKEMILRSIERQQALKESLYLLLLEKREEAAIENATEAPNVKIVDYAISSSTPVSPKKNQVYLFGILLGIAIPMGFIFLFFILDTNVYEKKHIEAIHENAPFIGEVPEFDTKKLDAISSSNDPLNHILENFRTMAHKLTFMRPTKKKSAMVVCVTSSVKGEGKTTIAFQLAKAFRQLDDKKVLLVGTDLRNPQIHTLINMDRSQKGLTNALTETEIDWETCVIPYGKKHTIDILLSGDIPPMPLKMLSSLQFKDWLDQVKHTYDYVILDTAPTLLVSDTLALANHVDVTVNVTRYGFTQKKLIVHSKNLDQENKVHNMVYVLNAIPLKNIFGYGYGYGYGYNYGYGYGYGPDSENKKPWYRFW